MKIFFVTTMSGYSLDSPTPSTFGHPLPRTTLFKETDGADIADVQCLTRIITAQAKRRIRTRKSHSAGQTENLIKEKRNVFFLSSS